LFDYRRITIDDAAKFKEYSARAASLSCQKSFAYVFMWSTVLKTEICMEPEAIYFRIPDPEKDGCYKYVSPLIVGDVEQILDKMLAKAHEKGCKLTLVGADEEVAVIAKNKGLSVKHSRGASEYLYATRDLIDLAGKKFHAKRNFVNRFIRENEYTYRRLEENDFDECLTLARKWKGDSDGFWINAEYRAIETVFEYWNQLSLAGGLIKIDGNIVAFTVGEVVGDMGIVHFEKANVEVKGIYAAINNFFAEDYFNKTQLINRQEDMNIPGLRKSKQSYNPIAMVNKYDISEVDK